MEEDNLEGLVFSKITHMSLLVGKCPNKHLHIFGFIQQCDWEVNLDIMKARTTAKCGECECEVVSEYSVEWDKTLQYMGSGI